MPPRTNAKAQAARDRKAEQTKKQKDAAAKEKLDQAWADDRKKTKHELKREEEERKAEEARKKKAEKKRLEEEENEKLEGKKKNKNPAVKVTQFQLNQMREKEELRKKEQEEAKRLESLKINPEANYAREIESKGNNRNNGEMEASGLDEALSVMTAAIEAEETMSYKRFEKLRIPQLQAENPGLKQSQLRDKIRKEWGRSPLNPQNQS
eukprot:m.24291 g.24291  ORF g.24291 m.24291 type:complete len:209 (+) comp7592_c0_seq1:135-761(+)